MRTLRSISAVVALLACAACVKDNSLSEFRATDELCIMIKGYTTFSYSPLTCQKGYNSTQHEFRVHTDNMSDFYTVRLDRIPTGTGQEVYGTVRWTTGNNIHSKKNVPFEVVRLEGKRIWLWSSKNSIAAVVDILE